MKEKYLCLVPPEFIDFFLLQNNSIFQLPHSFDIWCLGIMLLEIIEGFPIENDHKYQKIRIQTIKSRSYMTKGIMKMPSGSSDIIFERALKC